MAVLSSWWQYGTSLKFDQIPVSIAPVSDFTGHIQRMQQRVFLLSGLVLLVVIPLVRFVSRRISGSLIRLELESVKIGRRDFSESPPFDSSSKEIHALIQAFDLMKGTIRNLLNQRRKLFDDLTKRITGAIDANRMRHDRHIVSDLFDLFLESGVYEQYARSHLTPEQIDAVDINRFLSGADKGTGFVWAPAEPPS